MLPLSSIGPTRARQKRSSLSLPSDPQSPAYRPRIGPMAFSRRASLKDLICLAYGLKKVRRRHKIVSGGVTTRLLARSLALEVDRLVLDETGLEGELRLHYLIQRGNAARRLPETFGSLAYAIKDLGLKLHPSGPPFPFSASAALYHPQRTSKACAPPTALSKRGRDVSSAYTAFRLRRLAGHCS